jgi:NADPH-dependent 2,4-dienoyl-CoA reductase/sulfur reductase-like enzyme/predicted acylesterase/phospholipase RssA
MVRFPARAADFVLVGGGVTSATAAETLRLEGTEGSVAIVSAEDCLPYHRPPLSGRLKLEEAREPPPVLKEEDYRAHGIELLRGVRAVDVDPERHLLRTDKAGTLTYGKLLIATGATPVRLQVPGADLRGIHYLRTANDARAIQEAARKGRRCVVIGASFIGMEVSSALQLRGLDVQLVAGKAGIFAPLRDREIAEFFASLYAQKGIPVLKRVVAGFEGSQGAVETVVLDDGQRLACDFVVAGIGVRPDTDWLSGSGIAVDDGVVVNRDLMASVPDVYAAGDVASFFDPVFNLRRRIEHWDNAVKQGRLAARNMLGQRLPYDEVSGFFCQAFDVNFQFVGRAEEAPRRRSLGSLQERAWARLYLEDSVPRALFTMGRPARETAAIQALIRYRTNIEHLDQQLGWPGFVLADIPTQNVLVLQGGGALGAFECGALRALEEAAIHPDVVAGVSIGAFNGAIIAAHPRHASEALDSFWHDLAIASPAVGDENARKLWNSTLAMLFGVPGFFTPRWWPWSMSAHGWLEAWVSLYDHAPVRKLLRQYVDFEGLKASPVRLLVTAVNVETAQLEVFDSYVDNFTPDHILASGSLPPGLPWTTIGSRHYWDGGIVSNSPLEQVTERCGTAGKRVVVVDLFPHERPLPTNLMEVLARRDEIVYAERIRRASSEQALLHDARKLIESVLSTVSEATAARIRQLPPYVQVMGAPQAPSITRIIREGEPGEPAGRDFDFSLPSIEAHMKAGLEAGRRALVGLETAGTNKATTRPRFSQ